jgi:NhaP-type Na+/H+ or K+/H+ antiporter
MLTITGLSAPGLSGWLLAPLLLLVIRPALVLATTNPRLMNLRSRVFLGFFGVRGVAAIFYAAVVVGAHALPAGQERVVVWTTIACVIFSIIVHGVGATPLTRKLLD